jgi:acetate CoA/acetoacetate CoA-transferase alpha subunit
MQAWPAPASGGPAGEREENMECLSLEKAIGLIPDGATIMVGGFMGVGTPERLMDELVRQGKRDLTLICNDNARPGVGVGKLVSARLLKKTVVSHIGLNPETQKLMFDHELDVELAPQGTLIERIRAGGYGLGGVVTPTGVGTLVEEGKRKLEIDGKQYLLEMPLRADFALLGAFLCDYVGNLTYALTARNLNPVMAMAADTVIAQTEHIVPTGMIGPDHVMTPAALVDYVVAGRTLA